ncbi:MAG: hypothetical protein LGB69_06730 [Sulfurovum sp.]|nr:hypothetical protein [Sulfurovum sp.]
MLVNINTNPQRNLYYLGSLVLETLKDYKVIELFDLYEIINKKEEINMQLFIFVLDWLFIIDAIKQTNGKIELCL